MRGPPPNDPRLLRGHRRNRASTQATLPSEAEAAQQQIPELPPRKGKWRPEVIDWWAAVWTSPMSVEYLKVDKHGLYRLAVLLQDFWTTRVVKDRFRFAAEIRQQESCFGLTPVDRRRLQWEIDRAEIAVKKTAARRKRPDPNKDPRDVLKLT